MPWNLFSINIKEPMLNRLFGASICFVKTVKKTNVQAVSIWQNKEKAVNLNQIIPEYFRNRGSSEFYIKEILNNPDLFFVPANGIYFLKLIPYGNGEDKANLIVKNDQFISINDVKVWLEKWDKVIPSEIYNLILLHLRKSWLEYQDYKRLTKK